ncbi:MAG: phosphate acetyltransferase [Peptococcaceae bacterium]|nr:phosphate acetyltransferase [Peptococcaceae bacterium]
MDLITKIREKAKKEGKHIVLPEGTEKRTVKAAEIITKEKIAKVTLLGHAEDVAKAAAEAGADLTGVEVVDPAKSPDFDDFAATFCKLREKKGMTMDKAVATMKDPLYFGVMMVYKNKCDGMVAGAENSTGNVLRPALQIVKTKPGISSVSGAFIMITPKTEYGDNGILVFADCAVNPTITAEQMAEIAYCSAQTAREIADIKEPKVAMLSFSTKGSASHEVVDKVAEAVKIAQERYPDLAVDGELQMDAAIVPSVGQFKAPGSKVAGHANVLVFPSLEAGNIAYKTAQRFGGAEAVGPVLQGMAKPVNDLSRGCSIDDVVNTVAMVCCQK